jgi:hypothetical protein
MLAAHRLADIGARQDRHPDRLQVLAEVFAIRDVVGRERVAAPLEDRDGDLSGEPGLGDQRAVALGDLAAEVVGLDRDQHAVRRGR